MLVAEEDLGVLRVGKGAKSRIAVEVRGGPLPDVAEHLHRARVGGGIVVSAGRGGAEPEEVEIGAVAVRPGGRGLPLELGRQTLARPAGEGVGAVPVDVGHGAPRVERLATPEGGRHPAVALSLPVHRRLGARVGDELGVGAVGDRGAVDLERRQLDRVARPLVVVGEARCRGADLVGAGLDRDHLGPLGDRLGRRPTRRPGRARSRRPSAAAGAWSRCAGTRGRAASRR